MNKISQTHIVPLLKDYSQDVRANAVKCIAQFLPKLKQQRAVNIIKTDIVPLLKDKNYAVRANAVKCIAQFFPKLKQEKAPQIVISLLQFSISSPFESFNATLSCLHKYLALVVQQKISFQKYFRSFNSQIMKIRKATLSISQLPAQTKILQVADHLIRLKFDQITVEQFCSVLFQNDGILERQYDIIRDKLRVHQFLSGIVINRIRKDEKLLSGANYKALVELSKANPNIYDTILQIYKIPLEQTYSKVKQEGENSQTLRAIRQQLKNKELDIHSYFAQELLKKLIVLAIEDKEISEQDADLIYFCVQSNLTITFTYTPTEPNDFKNNFQHSYSIAFAGKTYPIQKGLEQYFGLLRNLFDGYGKLYARHKPQFINDGKHGLKIAAIDMAEVKEVFIDHEKILTRNNKLDRFIDWDKAIVIALKQGQQQFYLLSRRDEFGNINVTKIQPDKETCFILNPYKADNQALRKFKQGVIGSMEDNFYQLSVFSVGEIAVLAKNKQQLQQIIMNLQSCNQSVSKWKLLGEKVRPYKYLARDVQDMQQIIQKTGTAKKSSLIKQLQKLGDTEEQKSKIKIYSRTALFKLHYIVEAFNLLQTDMFQQNKDFRIKDELKYTDLAKTIVDTASEYIDMLPMFGDFVTKVTDFMKSKLQARQKRQQSNQRVVFRRIFKQNSSDPSDQALLVQEVVLQLTKLRKAYLLNGKEEPEQNLTLFTVFNQIKDQIAEIGLQKELKGQDQVDKSAMLACADVITFVMSIVNKKEKIMKMQFKREKIVEKLMRLFSEQHERDEREEIQERQGCFGRTKYCLYLYEHCCCVKQDISKQFEGLSGFEKFKRYFFACFCCFKCCESPRNPYVIGQSKPSKIKQKSSQLNLTMEALSSSPNNRQTLIKESSPSPKK